jgi:hypothetical protein
MGMAQRSRTVKVSTVRVPTVIRGRSFAEKQRANLKNILGHLRTAGLRGSDLVLCGEYANLHHRTWSTNRKEYIPDPIPGPFTRAISRIARR